MTVAYVGGTSNDGVNSTTNVLTYSPTAGNTLIIEMGYFDSFSGGRTITVTDNKGSTYNVGQARTIGTNQLNNYWTASYYVQNIASGITSITITWSGAVFSHAVVQEYSGLSTFIAAAAMKQYVNPGSGANAVASNSINITNQPATLIGYCYNTATAPTYGTLNAGTSPNSFTVRYNTGGSEGVITSEDAQITATGNTTATGTATARPGSIYMMGAMAFQNAPPPAGGPPTITSVSTSTPFPGQTSVTINGTNFTGVIANDTVTLIDGNNSAAQTITADTSTVLTITIVQGNCRYGTCTLKVTNANGTAATTVTLTPATGVQSINMGALRALTQTANPGGLQTTPSRLFDTPTDLIDSNTQVELAIGTGSAGTFGLNLDTDGRLWWDPAVKRANWRWIQNDGTGAWTSLYNWDLVGLFPNFTGPNLQNQNAPTGSAYSLAMAPFFGVNDSTETPYVYSISAGSLTGSGLSINSSTGVISGATPVAGTYTITVRATDVDGSYAESNSFSIVIAAPGTAVTFAGTIQNQTGTVGVAYSQTTSTFFTNATSYAIATGALPDGLTIASGTGVISGTPTGLGIPVGQSVTYNNISVTGSNANPSSATSNLFSITITNPAGTTTVPNLGTSSTQAAANTALVAANLTPSFPVTWVGTVNIAQSIAAGTVVATGSTVVVVPLVIFTGSIGNQTYNSGTAITPLNIASFFTYAQSYALDPTSGPLPPGLTLDPQGGTISGIPTGAGIAPGNSLAYTGIIVQGNTYGTLNTNSNAFSITIHVPLSTVAVPDVSSTHPTIASAAATLAAAGLGVAQVNQGNSGVAAGTVISQQPAAGVIVSTGTIVTCYVAVASTIPADALYPTSILGLTYDVVRKPIWNTALATNSAGKRSPLALQPYPLINFELNYGLLRDDLTISDLKALVGLFNAMQGRFTSFLFIDPEFNTIPAATPIQFAVSDGTTTTLYPITASYQNAAGPGYIELIQNFNGLPVLYDVNAGTVIPAGHYTLGPTGLVQFSTPTTSGHAILWSGQFYYRCRFDQDQYEWAKFMNKFWEMKKVSFTSIYL